MPNPRLAELISTRLVTGLTHPGDPDSGRKPVVVGLPVFRTTGQPQEVVDQINTIAKLLGEAIIALLEDEGGVELVSRDEMVGLRHTAAAAPGPEIMPVHCRCDRSYSDPLMFLTVGGPRIVIDGRQLIKGLSNRQLECPHTRMEAS